ncbi:MAG TPA: isocitrate/isopropylmalate dehydrogenase family protein [Solirubrobacteraceae bacterium]|nr:isocitrate/isopropylmalate dehydrogenase family protein [Solirubrobacteraceae bacterium]
MSPTLDIATIPGDGIGPEIVPVATEVLDRAAEHAGARIRWTEYDWGSEHFRRTGRMMPAGGLDALARHDAVFFGAVGDPEIPDVETLWGLLIPMRRTFDQYVNLRPARSFPGVPSPLAQPEGIDLVIVRENTEGEYSDQGGDDGELATQVARFTRAGVARVARYAAQLASERSGRLVSCTKSNGIIHTMPFWDRVVAETVAGFPGVQLRPVLVDALSAELVLRPQSFDVIVASNLFGDILSDLAAACVGSLGLAASANLNPERRHPSTFEPVHGSAPDIAGRGIANPLAQISCGAMMLRHLQLDEAANAIDAAVEVVLRHGPRTADLGGTASTSEVGGAVLAALGV